METARKNKAFLFGQIGIIVSQKKPAVMYHFAVKTANISGDMKLEIELPTTPPPPTFSFYFGNKLN